MSYADIQQALEAMRPADADYIIVAVGVHGPNFDCPDGNAVATVRIGHDEATSEALHLRDAIALARGKILNEREAAKRKAEKAKQERAA